MGITGSRYSVRYCRLENRSEKKTDEGVDFAPTAFQNLLYQAAGDQGTLPFAGRQRSINSIVLLSNGISFAIQVVVFLVIGSFADFGTWRPNILIVLSVIAYAIGFGWLGVHTQERWHIAVGLYIVGLIAYQTTLTFWTAAFPGLARNTAEMKDRADAYVAGRLSREEYDNADTMARSRLANVAFYVQSVADCDPRCHRGDHVRTEGGREPGE